MRDAVAVVAAASECGWATFGADVLRHLVVLAEDLVKTMRRPAARRLAWRGWNKPEQRRDRQLPSSLVGIKRDEAMIYLKGLLRRKADLWVSTEHRHG